MSSGSFPLLFPVINCRKMYTRHLPSRNHELLASLRCTKLRSGRDTKTAAGDRNPAQIQFFHTALTFHQTNFLIFIPASFETV